ncbi:MAG TPA: CoA transferase [Acidimicrobiales bacterium]|nr:CoA transferase [Acidimicrobiales bacterium]
MSMAFEGVCVLDFSQEQPGSLAAMVLADYGADVVKVQPPTAREPTGASLMFDRAKRSVALDLTTEADRVTVQRMAERADVVIVSFRPGVADRLGIGYDELSTRNPGLVYCSITGFGENGPYRDYPGYDAVVEAKSGHMMDFAGQVDRDGPIYAAVPVASFGSTNGALQGILAALHVRGNTGKGQRVDVSLLAGMTPYDIGSSTNFQLARRDAAATGIPVAPIDWSVRWPVPYLAACTKDGVWLQFANNMDRLYLRFMEIVGLTSLFWEDPRFVEGANTPFEHRLALQKITLERIREKTWAEWKELFEQDFDISVEPFLTTQQAMDHPQMRHNGSVVTVEDPRVGPMEQIGPLVTMTATPAKIGRPAPSVGENTAAVKAELEAGTFGSAPVVVKSPAPVPPYALSGVTVIEFAGWYAGPFGTTMVADLGARVIKVEPLEGDPYRPPGTYKTAAGKEGIAVNLQTEEGRRIAHQLVRQADVVMENYRPGVPERLGIDYETLKQINPQIIYLYAGLYGDSGPSMRLPGFHPTAGALAGGAIFQAGEMLPKDSSSLSLEEIEAFSLKLARANEANPDCTGAVVVGTAVLMGLLAKERTGQGQYMLTSMINSSGYANVDDFFRYEGKPERPSIGKEAYGFGPLFRLYQAAEGWVFVGAPTDAKWHELASAIGRFDLATEARFASATERSRHAERLTAELASTFAQRTADEWEKDLAPQGIAVVRADLEGGMGETLCTDPAMTNTGIMVEVEHPELGPFLRNGPVPRMSLTPGLTRPGNMLGQHTRPLLAELGYSEAEIGGLIERRIVLAAEGV